MRDIWEEHHRAMRKIDERFKIKRRRSNILLSIFFLIWLIVAIIFYLNLRHDEEKQEFEHIKLKEFHRPYKPTPLSPLDFQ